MRVLVAEDDPISQRILTNYLGKWGYEATVVTDGAEAWERIQQEDFPIVISDWVMPGLTGVELVQRIRDWNSPYGGTYAILLTGKASKEDLVAALEAGADDFVSKPFDRDELRVRLQAGMRIVQWDRAVQKQTAEIIVKLEAAQAALQTESTPESEGTASVGAQARTAVDAAREAARQLERTLRVGHEPRPPEKNGAPL